ASIRKRGDQWQVQVRRQNAPPISRTFNLKSDAEQWARQMEVEADRVGLPVDTRVLDRTTLRELIERYRDEVVVNKRGAAAYETIMLNAVLRQPFVSLSLSAVTPAVFTRYRDTRLKTVKPSTLCREFTILQNMYEVAIKDWSLPLASNPLKAVRRPQVGKGRDRRLAGVEELDALVSATDKCLNKLIRPLFLFALETGMRRSEIIRVRWSDVDFAKRTLHIPLTKNGHARTIPLTRKAVDILGSLPRSEDEPRVFPLSANAVKLAWRRLRERAKVPDLRFHDLRHEAVSTFFEKGLSMPEVALISGHRDTRMLMRYTHLRPEDVVAKLG
ncbi:MAG: tyrosine-type recombinase/integrase, partial [Ignavibacteriales bacterium]